MALSAAQRQFLVAHPTFASLLAGSDARALRTFQANHPDIVQAWNRIGTAPAPTRAAPTGVAAAAAAAPTAGGTVDQSARGNINAALSQFGLGSLGDWAWGQYLAGVPTSQIMLDLRARPEYAQRFPAMAQLAKEGRAISEQEYMSAEQQYRAQMHAIGLPVNMYDDPTDFAKLIVGGVSAQEFGDRLALRQRVALDDPRSQEYRDELARLYGYNVATGAITALYIDPDKALPVLQQQFQAAATAAAAARTGFGDLTLTEAEQVGATGVTEAAAQDTFSSLAQMRELQADLPGFDQGVTRQDLLGAGFTGDADAQAKVKRTQERRKAAFQGGGGYAASGKGVTGLGSAAT